MIAGTLMATNLIQCPDCDHYVSPRAIMCPNCGCPGDAIAESIILIQETKEIPIPLYPVATLKTDTKSNFALGYTKENTNFLLMDAYLLSQANSLAFTCITTNTPIPYSNFQTTKELPIIRFKTQSTNMMFLALSANPESKQTLVIYKDGSIKKATGKPLSKDVIGITDLNTNLISIVTSKEPKAINLTNKMNWIDVSPKAFREQTKLLAEAKAFSDKGTIPDNILVKLKDTNWISDYLMKQAD